MKFKKYSTATDTYTTLPATFQTSGADVENYQVYGETVENLFDYTATDPNNGYLNGYLLNDEGDPYAVSGCYGSEYIELGGNTDYTLVIRTSSGSYDLYFCLYDSNHNKSRVLSCNTYATFTTLSTEKYIRFSSPNSLASKTMLVKGSTVPTRYVPYGTPDGVGEETENLVDVEQWLDDRGATYTFSDGTYTIDAQSNLYSSPCYFSQENIVVSFKGIISNVTATFTRIDAINADGTLAQSYVLLAGQTYQTENISCAGFRMDWSAIGKIALSQFMVVKGSTAPTTFIPFGYKIPISLSVGYEYKEVHKDTVTIDGVVWDILGYDHDEVYDGEGNLAQHSVTIQTHDCIANLQFDEREALFAFPSGLSAGTYHFSVTQSPYSGDVGKTMQFTLMNNIPADGVIVLSNISNVTMIGSTISIYASPSATTAGETATISEGSDGTDLGSVGNAISGNTNSIQRALLGNNNYNQSAIRQFLNADGEAGTYWTPQNKWDRPPRWNASQAGFLNGFSSNFKNAIGTSKKVTALNTVCDGGGTETTNEKVFLLSSTEVYCGGSEGTAYSYYSDYSDLSDAGTGTDSNRIKQISNTAKYWWLRSCDSSYARSSRVISLNGSLGSYGVANPNAVAPAVCIPLDNINNDPYLQSLFLKPKNPNISLPYISNYDLFLGDSKLYEDEYVDFSEQKMYKRTAQLFDKDSPDIQMGKEISGTSIVDNDLYFVTEFIPVEPNQVYKANGDSTATTVGFGAGVLEYDQTYSLIRRNTNAAYSSFTTSATTAFIKLNANKRNLGTAMIVKGSTAPETYIPYLQPTDPPVPFTALSTYIGENNLSVDTTVQPEKVVLTVAAWREIEAKKYVNGSWTDIVVRRYENGAWVPSPIPENNIANLQGLLTLLEDHWLPGVNDYRSMILVRTNRNDDTANQLCYMLTCYSTNPSPHFASEFLNNRYWLNDYAVPYSGTNFYLRKFSWSQGGGWVYDGDEDNKRDDYFVPIDSNTYNVYLLRLGSSTQYDNNAGYQYFYDLSAYF